MEEKSKNWSDCTGIYTDESRVMAGNIEGLQTLIKRPASGAVWTRCTIRDESVATRNFVQN
jgi:hypothetical protein